MSNKLIINEKEYFCTSGWHLNASGKEIQTGSLYIIRTDFEEIIGEIQNDYLAYYFYFNLVTKKEHYIIIKFTGNMEFNSGGIELEFSYNTCDEHCST